MDETATADKVVALDSSQIGFVPKGTCELWQLGALKAFCFQQDPWPLCQSALPAALRKEYSTPPNLSSNYIALYTQGVVTKIIAIDGPHKNRHYVVTPWTKVHSIFPK